MIISVIVRILFALIFFSAAAGTFNLGIKKGQEKEFDPWTRLCLICANIWMASVFIGGSGI